jgi:hypothetical protein
MITNAIKETAIGDNDLSPLGLALRLTYWQQGQQRAR